MKTIQLIGWVLLGISTVAFSFEELDEEKVARINALMALDLKELSEVEIKLDDTFDVFDGLLRRQTVRVASGVKQDASNAPAVTTVITAQDIEATGARTLTEVLESVPNLHISYDPFNYSPKYIMRGIYSTFNPQILIMINGLPLKDLHSGTPSSRGVNLPVHLVQRIEIIRGPGSALYGADALAGIINIITKTAEDIENTEIGGRTGSFDTHGGWVVHGSKLQGFDVAAMVNYSSEKGHNELILQDYQSALDRRFKTNVSHAPSKPSLGRDTLDLRLDISKTSQKTGTWRVQASQYQVSNAGTGAGPAQAIDKSGENSIDIKDLVLNWQSPSLGKSWLFGAEVAFTDRFYASHDMQLYPNGAFGGQFPIGYNANLNVAEQNLRFNLNSTYKDFKNHIVRMGAGYFYGDQHKVWQETNWLYPPQNPHLPYGGRLVDISDTPFAFQPEEIRKNHYLFLQDAWHFKDDWELTLGGRFDSYSDFGETFNLRGALVWQIKNNLTAKVLYGEAFRAPSFQELYNVYNPVALGSRGLKPETFKTWELAFDWRPHETLHTGLNFYTFSWNDAIAFLSPTNAAGSEVQQGGLVARTAQNMGETIKGTGLELEMRWKVNSRSSLLFNYAVQRVKQGSIDWGNYPQQDAYVRWDWLFYPDWYLNTQLNWIGDRERPFGDPRLKLKGYAALDLTVRHKNIKNSHWNIAFGVKNLLNQSMFEPSPGPDQAGVIRIPNDLPLAGRSWFAEIRYKF
jgi:outer membrane receptor for ferrienterochelin and colicin